MFATIPFSPFTLEESLLAAWKSDCFPENSNVKMGLDGKER
jgi:hypothetical protein